MPPTDVWSGEPGVNLEALSSVVFERTDLGTSAIKSSANDIPRRLRTLMLVVDGRSNVAQYEPFLSALGPLPEKFAELERLGYLHRKGNEPLPVSKITDVVSRPVIPPAMLMSTTPSTSSVNTSSLTEADLLSFALDASALAGPNFGDTSSNFAPDLQTLASNLNRAPEAKLSAAIVLPDSTRGGTDLFSPSFASDVPTLQELLGEMENFLASVAGLDGLPLALMFGQITSLAQLRRELPSYLMVLQPYGAQADAHVERLAGLLDRAQR